MKVPLNCGGNSSGGGSSGGAGGSCAGRGFIQLADSRMSVIMNSDVKVRLYCFMFGLSEIILLLMAIPICFGAYNVYVAALLMNNISRIGYHKPRTHRKT